MCECFVIRAISNCICDF